MNNSWEEHMPYAALCLEVLALFYGIYFTKVLLQKRRVIQTRQIGRRKERALHTVELWMSAATLGVVIAQLLSVALGWSIKKYKLSSGVVCSKRLFNQAVGKYLRQRRL